MRSTRKRLRQRRSCKKQRAGFQLKIQYGQKTVAGQEFTVAETAEKPATVIPAGHYLVLYDPDAVQPSYIHWISSPTGDTVSYQGPSPPPGTGIHRYCFSLCKGIPPTLVGSRGGQNPADYIKKTVATVFFTVRS